jgi:hypothetical protein
MSDLTPHAAAYLNFDRWVADCPNPRCTNAMQVWPGQREFRCEPPLRPDGSRSWQGHCGLVVPLDFPPDPGAVEADYAHLPEAHRSEPPGSAGPDGRRGQEE